jgi:transposase
MAKAVNCALNHWQELSVFAGDQRVHVDNSASERDMRRVVLNRKNGLFVSK